MKTFRAPGIEELFSDGPHLAAYSYEIGNSELGTEDGWGTEAFLRYSVGRVKLNLALFRNQIFGYLIPTNTGKRSGVAAPRGGCGSINTGDRMPSLTAPN